MVLKLVSMKKPFCGSRRADPQEIITKEYGIPWPKSMSIPSFGTSGGKADVLIDITWDERYTTFHQALLTWSAHYFVGIYAQRAAEVRIYVNDSLVSTRGWQAYEGCQTKGNLEGLNIGAYIKNGTNKFTIELVGSWSPEVSGVDNITGFLVAQFTGKEPKIKPTEPQWVTYLKWGALGVGILGAVYLGIRAYEARRKK